jgi:tRNA modification GTPase
MGMKKIHALIEKSSLILFVIDQSQALSDDDLNVYQKIKDHKNIAIILMKSDLPTGLKKDDYTVFNPVFIAPCSIHDEQSIHNLKEQLYQHTISELSAEDLQYICNVRQLSCIRRLQNHVDQALDTLKQNIPDDLLSVDIRLCVEICSELSGDALTEEMLDGVFSRFCVGK